MIDPVVTHTGGEDAPLPDPLTYRAPQVACMQKAKLLPPESCSDLMSLADAINEAHDGIERHGRGMIESAVRAGEALAQIKAAVGHGSFQRWVEANCRCSYRSARRYMQVAKLARERLANAGRFEEGISAFLAQHGTKSRAASAPTSVARTESAEGAPDRLLPGCARKAAEAVDHARAADAAGAARAAPVASAVSLQPIRARKFTDVAEVEAALAHALGARSVKLDDRDPEIFQLREHLVDQLMKLGDEIAVLVANMLLLSAMAPEKH